jgi:hypothetical protein
VSMAAVLTDGVGGAETVCWVGDRLSVTSLTLDLDEDCPKDLLLSDDSLSQSDEESPGGIGSRCRQRTASGFLG